VDFDIIETKTQTNECICMCIECALGVKRRKEKKRYNNDICFEIRQQKNEYLLQLKSLKKGNYKITQNKAWTGRDWTFCFIVISERMILRKDDEIKS
jgi:hypothetical protein